MLEELTTAFQQILNTSGYYRDADEITAFFNQAQGWYFLEWAPRFQRDAIATQKLTPFLRQFRLEVTTTDQFGNGVFVFEGTNREIYSVPLFSVKYDGDPAVYPIPLLSDNQFWGRANDPVSPPTLSEPIMKSNGADFTSTGSYTILPAEAELESSLVYGDCLCYPRDCEVAFVPGTDDYDPSNSIDMEWSIAAIVPILTRALTYTGLNLDSTLISKVAATLNPQNK